MARRICSIFPLCMESKALVKSTNNIVASWYFLHVQLKNSTDRRICEVTDLFLRKPFWFVLNIFSILSSMRLRSRTLYILAAMDVRIIPRWFLPNPRSTFLGKGWKHPFVHPSIVFWLYMALQCRSSMLSNCLVFHTSGGFSSNPVIFLFLIFLSTESSSSCVKLVWSVIVY